MSTNFAFMKNINQVYYKTLDDIEREARIKPKNAARNCRALLESFINDLFTKNNISTEDKLHNNLKTLFDQSRQLGIPWIENVEYEVVDMNKRVTTISRNGLFYIKDLANAASHVGLPTEKGQVSVLVSSQAITKALRIFHVLFTGYYGNRLKGEKNKFLDANIPLGDYEISQCYVPADSERSKCIMEYVASRRIGEYSKARRFALIREYLPDEMEKLFLNRNVDTFSEANPYIYTDGVTVAKLNKIEESYANFFIAYEFADDRPVVPLAKFLKKNKLEMKDRIDICLKIAESMSKFHNADDPIYHRMLTYESILISDFTDKDEGYKPYVTKFDFAKITSITDGTVYKNLTEAEAKETEKLSRYKLEAVAPDLKWDKVDIYSLGVLFVDIMLNGVSSKTITESTFEELIDEGISDGMIEIIDEMLYDIPDERPNINKVLEVISEESKRFE